METLDFSSINLVFDKNGARHYCHWISRVQKPLDPNFHLWHFFVSRSVLIFWKKANNPEVQKYGNAGENTLWRCCKWSSKHFLRWTRSVDVLRTGFSFSSTFVPQNEEVSWSFGWSLAKWLKILIEVHWTTIFQRTEFQCSFSFDFNFLRQFVARKTA